VRQSGGSAGEPHMEDILPIKVARSRKLVAVISHPLPARRMGL
jgi:hypothetical protein